MSSTECLVLDNCLSALRTGERMPHVSGITLTDVLGQGGMGTVYKGLHVRLSIPVAVKFLKNADSLNAERFLLEAQLAARINNRNVVRVYDVQRDEEQAYIVQEFVDGRSAFHLIEENVRRQRFMPESRVLDIAADVARGLAAIHAAGVVHLDIKPENVLLEKDSGTAKIADLGLARRHGDGPENAPLAGEVFGTPGFMSPEQLEGGNTGPASDVYSLGALIYELAVNRTAFDANGGIAQLYIEQSRGVFPNPRKIRNDLGSGIVEILRRCLSPNPEKRYTDGGALLAAILEARAQLQEGGMRSGRYQPAAPTAKVVCVDDDACIRELVSDILGGEGHTVTSFATGREALLHLAAREADLVLLDLEMPGDNGLKVCRMLRALPNMRDIPIVFLSSVGDLNVMDMLRDIGATDFLVKPVSPADLLARVECLTRLRRIEREKKALEAQYKKMSSRYIRQRAV